MLVGVDDENSALLFDSKILDALGLRFLTKTARLADAMLPTPANSFWSVQIFHNTKANEYTSTGMPYSSRFITSGPCTEATP